METKPEKSFRLQNRKIHLTYKTHIDPEIWLAWAKGSKKLHIDSYSIVHETSDENHPYPHTHILLDSGKNKKFNTTNCRFFDWILSETKEVIHPNIATIKTNKHWDNAILYHYKESKPFTNIEKPITAKEEIENIWKCDSVSDALLSTCSSLKNIGGIIAAFNCKPSDYGIEPNVDWKPWQKELIDETRNKPDDRSIIWYYDLQGGSGKSFIAKHLGMYQDAFVSSKANTYHIATQLDEFIKANGDTILIVVFNFTRQQENHKIYQALEELKDGLVTAEKYKGKTLYFKSPHVICLANYIPEVKHFTADRWDIRVLQDDKVIKRYLAGKTVFEDKNIDPYINYTLKDLDNQYQELANEKNSFEIKRKEFLSKIDEKKIPEIPINNVKPPSCRPFNINGATNLATLETLVPPTAPYKTPQSLIGSPTAPHKSIQPLVLPSAPQKEIVNGYWEKGLYITNNLSLNNIDSSIECENEGLIYGRWSKGIFYPQTILSKK